MIQALLKRGADVNLADSETGDTLLMSAAKYSTPEVVQVLIEAGANANTKNKLTPMGPMPNRAGTAGLVRLCTKRGEII
jgi:ankyrin repeat protein